MTAAESGRSAEIALGYWRDASWWAMPNTTDPKRLHRDGGNGFAACNSTKIMLNLELPTSLADLPHDDHLCRRCFPDAGIGHPLADVIQVALPPGTPTSSEADR